MTHNEQSSKDSDSSGTPPSQWTAFATMGISSAVIVALGVVVGILADGAFHTSPLFLFVGIVLGCALAVISAVTQVKRFM